MADKDDVIKGASRFFSKLGSTLKHVGGEVADKAVIVGGEVKDKAKQVTGLGRGDVKVELDQVKWAPGSTIRGNVVLNLPKPVAAKRLVATLRARQKIMTISKTSSGKSVGTSHTDVFQFDAELGGAQDYTSGTHAFELPVPAEALDLRPSGSSGVNPLADAVRTVASALSPSQGPIEWEVIGRLEIAWGRDLSKSVDILIQR